MYAIVETEHTRQIDFEFADGSYFFGNVNLGIEWDGDWKLQWIEGIFRDAQDNETVFTADTGIAQSVMRQLNNDIAFRRHATDWAEEALQEHKDESFYNYDEQH